MLATSALLLAGVVAFTAGGDVPTAEAVVGGSAPDSTVASSSALVEYKGRAKSMTCSGALISEWWVVTAAHCARPQTTGRPTSGGATTGTDAIFGATLEKEGYTIFVGSDTKARATKVKVSQVWAGMPRWTGSTTDGTGGFSDDIAFLKLATPAPVTATPMPIVPSGAPVGQGSVVAVSGWGWTGQTQVGGFGTLLRTTRSGDWKITGSCGVTKGLCYGAARSRPQSYPWKGDSGAPITTVVRGARVQVGVYSGGSTDTEVWRQRHGASLDAYRGWVAEVTGVRELPRNTVVKQAGSSASWFIDGDGFRHAIPTTAVYQCLVARHGASVTKTRFETFSTPEDTARATCATAAPSLPSGNSASFAPGRLGVSQQTTLSIQYTNRTAVPMERFGIGMGDRGTRTDNQGAFAVVEMVEQSGPPNWCSGPLPGSASQGAYYVCQPTGSRDERLMPGETTSLTISFKALRPGTAKLYIGTTWVSNYDPDTYFSGSKNGDRIAELSVDVV